MTILTEKLSLQDYLDLEQQAGHRYEYLEGETKAMAGTTVEHDFICNNLIKILEDCLRKKGCFLVSGQVKMYAPHGQKAFLYPDIHIYCGALKKEKLPQGAYALVEPSFIIEVLSRETRHYDRVDKFDYYQQIPSLQGYLMIESDLEKRNPALHLRSWEDQKSFQEEVFTLQDTLEILGCPLEGKKVYDLPNLSS